MGADGCWLIEYRHEYREGVVVWGAVAQSANPCMPRDYGLFGLLNGVRARQGVSPIVPPRGFPPNEPDDYNARMHRERFDEADAGATWLTTQEAELVAETYAKTLESRSVDWDAVVAVMKSLEANGRECRVLFATDQW